MGLEGAQEKYQGKEQISKSKFMVHQMLMRNTEKKQDKRDRN